MARLYRSSLICMFIFVIISLTLYTFRNADQGPIEEVGTEHPSSRPSPAEAQAAHPHLVVATLIGDDTSWIQKRLPGWTSSIYVANDPSAALTVPVNKGREAMVYLTYMIDHYDALPPTILFIHGRQYQWHNDDSNYDGATVLSRFRNAHLLRAGYVNLRCVWTLGCPDEIHVQDPREQLPAEKAYKAAFLDLFPDAAGANGVVPDVVGASCCAQFGVTREMVRRKGRAEYERIRTWLRETPLEDEVSGRVMEYSWHMFFDQPPVHCPSAQQCYCEVFGICDLQGCTKGTCPSMYKLPKYSTQPDDWKPLPEYENATSGA